MTLSLIVLAAVMGSTAAWAGQSQTAADINATDYYGLVNKLNNNDLHVDFKALRLSYTKTQDYQPYGGDDRLKKAAFEALNKKDFAEAIRLAESALEKNYVDLDLHLLCRIAHREMGHSEKYDFHSSVLQGLINSIYASGDGTTPEKAMGVISIDEEYFCLNANGLNMTKSSLITADGHNYDRMDVENKKTSERSAVYFNGDIPFGWLNKSFQKK